MKVGGWATKPPDLSEGEGSAFSPARRSRATFDGCGRLRNRSVCLLDRLISDAMPLLSGIRAV